MFKVNDLVVFRGKYEPMVLRILRLGGDEVWTRHEGNLKPGGRYESVRNGGETRRVVKYLEKWT